MHYSKGLKFASLLGLVAAIMGTPALASRGSGVTGKILATGDLSEVVNYNHDRIKIQTKDLVDVRVQQLNFSPGAYTGWHHHPGIVIVTVAAGEITTVDQNCQTKTYGPNSPNGSVFVEGHDTPMEARSATGGIVFATYVAPNSGSPSTPLEYVFRLEDDEVLSCPRP
ncbi:MAG: hypothetical protein M3R03_01940 [Pseudomonadota bacterium]|nr:hypothetical protein [Pseudomonadota bacterium]